MIFGVKQLKVLEDWRDVVSKKNWVPSRSAYELAVRWQKAPQFPKKVTELLNTTSERAFQGLRRNYVVVEMPTFLDTLKAPSWTDLMVYAHNEDGEPIVIGVEGKTDEPFAERVQFWVRDSSDLERQPKETRLRRLKFLSRILRVTLEPNCRLRYQLLHRTAALLLEAEKVGAKAALVLIHSFDDAKPDNWNDYVSFLNQLGIQNPEKMKIAGPVSLGHDFDINMFFGWVHDERT